MTVYAITDTKKGEQGLRLLIFKLGPEQPERPEQLLVTPEMWLWLGLELATVCNSATETTCVRNTIYGAI